MATEHTIDLNLPKRLGEDEVFRKRYFRARSRNEVASQLIALRRKRGLRQADLAKKAKTGGQSAISRIEKADYEGWNYKTLLSVAEALEATLHILFEPWENAIPRQSDQDIEASIMPKEQYLSGMVAKIGEELFGGESESYKPTVESYTTTQSFSEIGASQYSINPRS